MARPYHWVGITVSTAGLFAALAGAGGGTASVQHQDAAAKPKPVPIVVRDFRFVGFDRDVVGRFRSMTPDGVPDGHFRVVLVRPKGAPDGGGFMLWRCPSKPAEALVSMSSYTSGGMGCEGARLLASTHAAPPSSPLKPAAIAVFREGKRHTQPRLDLPRSAAPVRFDLYVNGGPGCPLETGRKGSPDCRAAFAPGQRYVLMVAGQPPPGFSRWIARPGDKVPQVTSPQAALRNLRFVGLDKDVLGPGGDSPPDGKPDAHWTVEVATPAGPRMIQTIVLERAEASTDRPGYPIYWCAPGCPDQPPADPRYRALHVTVDGERVLAPAGSQTVNLDLPYTTSWVRVDIWATQVDPSVFTPGQRFRLSVTIAPEGGSPPGSGRDALPKFNPATPWLTLPGG